MKPYVICHMMSSLDGRIKQKNWALKNAAHYFEDQAEKIKVDAWIVGRTTMQEFCSKKPVRKKSGRFPRSKNDFVADYKQKTFAVAIDPQGKCRWDKNSVSTEHVIEVLSEQVSGEYLDHLRSKNVSYIFAGRKTLNLALALRKLNRLFNIRRVRIDGGGTVNGSFLKAGLIDEFSLVLSPLADGTVASPSVFEVDDGSSSRKATHFKLISVKKIDRDFLWLRYLVKYKNVKR